MSDYREELRVIRTALGLTQAQLGSVLGVEPNSVMRYERGYRQVPEPVIRLARQILRMQGKEVQG